MIIYTDGACSGNPGPGGFGVAVLEGNTLINSHAEYSEETTNNREEMKAIIWAMYTYGQPTNNWHNGIPIVKSDSAYAVNTFNDWMFRWEKNGWLNSKNKVPENLDLVLQYWKHYQEGYRIELVKIPGHSGDEWNDFVDHLAVETYKKGNK